MERLRKEELLTGGFSSIQFGFENGKGTVDAIRNVWAEAVEARAGRTGEKRQCVLVKLDVKNAFNLTPWRSIDGALMSQGISAHMVRTIRSYLSERAILIGTNGTETRAAVYARVPQRSVLDPIL